MDPITIITYICACLGGILLFLCIILAGFLLASYCKKTYVQYQGNGYFQRNTTQNSQRYIIVSPEEHDLKEDGNVLLQRYDEFLENEHIDGSILSQHMPDNNSTSTPRKTSFRIVSELDLKKGNIKKKQIQPSNTKDTPPVQKKLFWKKRKQTNPRDDLANHPKDRDPAKFTKQELDIPKEPRLYKRKSSLKWKEPHRKRSQSEWNISDTSSLNSSRTFGADDENEIESLLPVSNLGSKKGTAPTHSQYFDALETIDEDDDFEPNNNAQSMEIDSTDSSSTSSSSWETDTSLSSKDDLNADFSSPPKYKGSISTKSHSKRDAALRLREMLSREKEKGNDDIRKRLKAIQNLQLEIIALESKFYLESSEIESRIYKERREKLYKERRRIIDSTVSSSGNEGAPEGFWIRAMLFCDTIKEIIQTHDIPILEFLKDIKISHNNQKTSNDSHNGASNSATASFCLQFEFDPSNGYFTDQFLTKQYTLQFGFTDAKSFKSSLRDPNVLAHYDGVPKVVSCKGCKIHWIKGKNATLRPVRKLNRETGGAVLKWAKRNSFFNFFTPPKVNTGYQKLPDDPKKILLMQAHYEIGLYFKETFVPKASIFYLKSVSSEYNVEESSSSLKESDDYGCDTKPRNIPSTDKIYSQQQNIQVSQQQNDESRHSGNEHEKSQPERKRRPHSYLLNERKKHRNSASLEEENSTLSEQSTQNVSSNGAPCQMDEKTSDVEEDVEGLMTGRYRMTSSEGFDEFMKALGVGMMKRKLANSVTPVVVIEISDDGAYTIRTETTVRTTEIKFYLGKTFSEATIDGRVTDTTPIRNENVITLDQKGNPSKKEKDTQMVREFVRSEEAVQDGPFDLMLLAMQVDDVICKRVYTRIPEYSE